MFGWPFVHKRKKRRQKIKPEKIIIVNDDFCKKWILIEPNGNLHYGFLDASLLNFPSHNDEVWYNPLFYDLNVKVPSENHIKIVITDYNGAINPWALLLGYEIEGPFIFNSDYPFGLSDIKMLEKLINP